MTLPSNIPSEVAIIGCCLLGGLQTASDAVEGGLDAICFDGECQDSARVIKTLVGENRAIDLLSFCNAWRKVQGSKPVPAKILASMDSVPSASNLPHYLAEVADAYQRRQLILKADEILTRAQDPTCDVQSLSIDLANTVQGDSKAVGSMGPKEIAGAMVDEVQRRYNLKGSITGLGTGFPFLDKCTDGLQFGEQTIIGARPSMGKTALGLNIIESVCIKRHIPSLFVSLEMSPSALSRRLFSSHENIHMGDVKSGNLTERDFNKLASFNQKLSKAPFHILDFVRQSGDITRIASAIRTVCAREKIQLVVIDYLQKIKAATKNEKKTYEVGEVSGILKALAAKTGAAFVTLAQLNRETDKDKERLPRLGDLADSGQIERDGDLVIFIHRDKDDQSKDGALVIAKQRDGEIGLVPVRFRGEYCRFEEVKQQP
jgi:replicative DNA helicase